MLHILSGPMNTDLPLDTFKVASKQKQLKLFSDYFYY